MKTCKNEGCEAPVYSTTGMCQSCFNAYEKARYRCRNNKTMAKVKEIKAQDNSRYHVHPDDRRGVNRRPHIRKPSRIQQLNRRM